MQKMTKKELGKLIIDCEDTMYHIAKTILYSDTDCSDAISEGITKAFEKITTLKDDRNAKAWLIKIVINECYQIIRKQKKIVSFEQIKTEQGELIYQRDDYSDLYMALKHLNEKERLCIVLYYLDGYSIKEIAQIVNSTESAIKQRLVRGRKHMRDELEGGIKYGYE